MPEDFAALAKSGVTVVINNRPDSEVPPELSSTRMQAAAEAAGLVFVNNPVVTAALGVEVGQRQRDAIDAAQGTAHAYCASGTRSAIAWALGEAERQNAADILAATAKAGFALDGLRDILDSLRARDAS